MEGLPARRTDLPEAVLVMRSLLISLLGGEPGVDRSDLARSRPEALRRKTIAANSRIILASSMLATPPAAYLLLQGALMPFVLSTIGLTVGFITFALQRRGQYERAAFGQ